MNRIQLHPSGVDMFESCGEAFRRRYILGDIRPPSSFLVVGRAADKAISEDLTEKIKTGRLLTDAQVEELAAETVEQEFHEEVDFDNTPKNHAKLMAQDRAVKLAGFAHRHLNPTIHPKQIQREWSVRLDELLAKRGVKGMKIDYVGTMDIEEHVFEFGDEPIGTAIRDIKTSEKSPPANAADAKHFIQLTSYALGKKVMDNEYPVRVQVDYLVTLQKGVQHKPCVSTRTDYDMGALLNRIEVMARSLKAGIFAPAAPGHWKCSRKWCGYYSTCPYVNNRVSANMTAPKPELFKLVPKRKDMSDANSDGRQHLQIFGRREGADQGQD